jgi:hypothetical protein
MGGLSGSARRGDYKKSRAAANSGASNPRVAKVKTGSTLVSTR